jgi:CBS domain-containing protein
VPAVEASLWLLEAGYRHLPVVEGDELLGIVDVRDLLWALTST